MGRMGGVGAVCLLLVPVAGPRPAAAETRVVVLKAARLFDGRGGPLLAPAMVRVEGDRIAAVRSARAGSGTWPTPASAGRWPPGSRSASGRTRR